MIWNSVIKQNFNIYLYHQKQKQLFKHEKTIKAAIKGFYKYFRHFELLASNTVKNKTRIEFKNLLRINLVKYLCKFLAHIKENI